MHPTPTNEPVISSNRERKRSRTVTMAANDLSADIKLVLDISSRVDERVKIIQSNQLELSSRMHQVSTDIVAVSSRVTILESKNGNRINEVEDELNEMVRRVDRMDVAGTSEFRHFADTVEKAVVDLKTHDQATDFRLRQLEGGNDGWKSKMEFYWGLGVKAIWVCVVCYVLYKLGLNPPPIP